MSTKISHEEKMRLISECLAMGSKWALSPASLSYLVGVHPKSLSDWRRKQSVPNVHISKLLKLKKFLGVLDSFEWIEGVSSDH